jgi:cell division septation protein DedD
MEQVKTWVYAHRRIVGAIIFGILAVIVAVLLFRGCKTEPQKVTVEPQNEAQTETGVEKAADNAQVQVSRQQAQDAAQEIHYIYEHDTKPEYTIVTTGGDVERQAQAAQEHAGADFSIVASDDGEKADVASISKDKPVELNQYNVQAYKKVLHTVEVSPDIEGGRGIAEVGYSVSHKVSRDGKYLGVGASYNFDSNKAYVKMTYTW